MSILTEITEAAFGVSLEILYATPNNFTGQPVYARAACYLHPDAAHALAKAADLAAHQGLRLHLYDGFRPAEAQWVLWNHTPNPEFISDPRRGSPHSMGAAIDLTLADATTGALLDMGTAFDDLTAASHHGATGLSAEAQRNRFLLLGLMTTAGWDFYRNEWWHYQLFKARERYPVLSDAEAGTRLMGERHP